MRIGSLFNAWIPNTEGLLFCLQAERKKERAVPDALKNQRKMNWFGKREVNGDDAG